MSFFSPIALARASSNVLNIYCENGQPCLVSDFQKKLSFQTFTTEYAGYQVVSYCIYYVDVYPLITNY